MAVRYHRRMCRLAIEVMGSGGSKTDLAHRLAVPLATLAGWAREHPEFAQALETGETFAQGWWERLGREAMLGRAPGFDFEVWREVMVKRFGWSEVIEAGYPGESWNAPETGSWAGDRGRCEQEEANPAATDEPLTGCA